MSSYSSKESLCQICPKTGIFISTQQNSINWKSRTRTFRPKIWIPLRFSLPLFWAKMNQFVSKGEKRILFFFLSKQRRDKSFESKCLKKLILDFQKGSLFLTCVSILSWGPHSTLNSVLALHPAAPGLILGVHKKFSSLDVADIYWRHFPP